MRRGDCGLCEPVFQNRDPLVEQVLTAGEPATSGIFYTVITLPFLQPCGAGADPSTVSHTGKLRPERPTNLPKALWSPGGQSSGPLARQILNLGPCSQTPQ